MLINRFNFPIRTNEKIVSSTSYQLFVTFVLISLISYSFRNKKSAPSKIHLRYVINKIANTYKTFLSINQCTKDLNNESTKLLSSFGSNNLSAESLHFLLSCVSI